MKISIVTISYNQGEFLEEAIHSVINQRGVDLEYIIVDPGSTDQSRKIIEKYKDSLAHTILEPDNGPGNGLNKGFAKASADIFGYINSDDILMPGTLKKVVDFFGANPGIDIVSAHGYVLDEFSRIRHKVFSNQLQHTETCLKQFCCSNYILVQQSTFFRRNIFEKVNGFDETGKVVWDAGLIIDFIKAGAKFKVINDYWSGFRIYSNSLSGSGFFENQKIFQELETYAGVSSINKVQKSMLLLLKWISEPHIFFMRFMDGIKNPERLI